MLNIEINEQLVAAAAVKEGDVVMEIGQGTRSLTLMSYKCWYHGACNRGQ